MKLPLLFGLLLCLVSSGCAVVALPVAAVGAVAVTGVKTTGAIVSAPFDDDDDDEDDEDSRDRRKRHRHHHEVYRAEVYEVDPAVAPAYY